MSGPYLPPGFAPAGPSGMPGELRPPRLPSVEEARQLVGARGWLYAAATGFVAGPGMLAMQAAMFNGPAPPNFTVPDGYEGYITLVAFGPHVGMPDRLDVTTGNLSISTWWGQLRVNGVPVPGYEFITILRGGRSLDGWTWEASQVYVGSGALIESWAADMSTGTSANIWHGSQVGGLIWPVQARLTWAARER